MGKRYFFVITVSFILLHCVCMAQTTTTTTPPTTTTPTTTTSTTATTDTTKTTPEAITEWSTVRGHWDNVKGALDGLSASLSTISTESLVETLTADVKRQLKDNFDDIVVSGEAFFRAISNAEHTWNEIVQHKPLAEKIVLDQTKLDSVIRETSAMIGSMASFMSSKGVDVTLHWSTITFSDGTSLDPRRSLPRCMSQSGELVAISQVGVQRAQAQTNDWEKPKFTIKQDNALLQISTAQGSADLSKITFKRGDIITLKGYSGVNIMFDHRKPGSTRGTSLSVACAAGSTTGCEVKIGPKSGLWYETFAVAWLGAPAEKCEVPPAPVPVTATTTETGGTSPAQ